MPAPTASQLESVVQGALASARIAGDGASGLAKAIAETIAAALQIFLAQAMVMPGIPAAAPPPAGSGATVGPGRLLPPPAGGPDAGALQSIALAQLRAQGVRGDRAGALAAVLAGAVAHGVLLFTAQIMVAPGIAIAGFATATPGRLV